jgi:hypothetical protein
LDGELCLRELGYVTDDKDATLEGLGDDKWVWEWRAGGVGRLPDREGHQHNGAHNGAGEEDEPLEDLENRLAKHFNDTILTYPTFLRMLNALQAQVVAKVNAIELTYVNDLIEQLITKTVADAVVTSTEVKPFIRTLLETTEDAIEKNVNSTVDNIVTSIVESTITLGETREAEREGVKDILTNIVNIALGEDDDDNQLTIEINNAGDNLADSISVSSGEMSDLPPTPPRHKDTDDGGSVSVSSRAMSDLPTSSRRRNVVEDDDGSLSVSSGVMSSLGPSVDGASMSVSSRAMSDLPATAREGDDSLSVSSKDMGSLGDDDDAPAPSPSVSSRAMSTLAPSVVEVGGGGKEGGEEGGDREEEFLDGSLSVSSGALSSLPVTP